MHVDRGRQVNFLYGDDLLVFADLTITLGLFKPVFAIIHQLTNRWTRAGRYLDQIQLTLLSEGQSGTYGHHAHLFAVLVDYANFSVAYLLIDQKIIIIDSLTPPLMTKK